MASMVVIFWPAAAEIGVTQERMAWPFMCTVQAPHSAAPQPNLVPVISSVSRRAHRMGVSGSRSMETVLPLMVRSVIAVSPCCGSVRQGWGPRSSVVRSCGPWKPGAVEARI